MRIIIAGTRDYDDYELLKIKCDEIIATLAPASVTIVSGTARGPDKMGEQYAKEKGYDVIRFPADWKNHGLSAGYKRNLIMAKNADVLIAFWDGRSKGTRHMIDIAHDHNLKVFMGL